MGGLEDGIEETEVCSLLSTILKSKKFWKPNDVFPSLQQNSQPICSLYAIYVNMHILC